MSLSSNRNPELGSPGLEMWLHRHHGIRVLLVFHPIVFSIQFLASRLPYGPRRQLEFQPLFENCTVKENRGAEHTGYTSRKNKTFRNRFPGSHSQLLLLTSYWPPCFKGRRDITRHQEKVMGTTTQVNRQKQHFQHSRGRFLPFPGHHLSPPPPR